MSYRLGEWIRLPKGAELDEGPSSDADLFFLDKERLVVVARDPVDGSLLVRFIGDKKGKLFYLRDQELCEK